VQKGRKAGYLQGSNLGAGLDVPEIVVGSGSGAAGGVLAAC